MRLTRLALLLLLAAPEARAVSLDPSSFTAPLEILTAQAADACAQAIGLGGDFKPLTGVDPPSGPIGLEVGVQTQASAIPDEFRAVLVAAGYTQPLEGVIPAARLHANLRLGSRFALEGGWLNYQGYKLTGIAAKLKIIEPEEGFGAALRLGYADNDLGIVSTRTWTPAVIVGAKLAFAEPYMGMSYSFAKSKVSLPIDFGGGMIQTMTADGKKNGLALFGGLVFDLAAIQIAFEGNYSNAGVPGLAVRVGVRL